MSNYLLWPCQFHVTDYSIVQKFQEYFQQEGIGLKKKDGTGSGIANIKVKKVFLVDEVADGIYLNRGKFNMGYFEFGKENRCKLMSHVLENSVNQRGKSIRIIPFGDANKPITVHRGRKYRKKQLNRSSIFL